MKVIPLAAHWQRRKECIFQGIRNNRYALGTEMGQEADPQLHRFMRVQLRIQQIVTDRREKKNQPVIRK